MPKQTFFNLPEEKRQLIIDLAIDEFAAHNYRSASISRLVERAGIAKGSFYQYFEDKKDLFMYLIDLVTQAKIDFLNSARPPDPEMEIFAYMSWLFQEGVRFQLAHPRLSQLGYRAVYGDSPLADEVISQASAAGQDYFRQLLEKAMARGDIDPTLDPDLVAFVFNTVMSALGTYMFNRLGIDPLTVIESDLSQLEQEGFQALYDDLLRILQYGMGARPDRPDRSTGQSPVQSL